MPIPLLVTLADALFIATPCLYGRHGAPASIPCDSAKGSGRTNHGKLWDSIAIAFAGGHDIVGIDNNIGIIQMRKNLLLNSGIGGIAEAETAFKEKPNLLEKNCTCLAFENHDPAHIP